MDESELHDLVAQSDAVSDPEPIAEATLETLGEAIAPERAAAVANWLPDSYRATLTSGDAAATIGHEPFLERVRERERALRDGMDSADVGDTGDEDCADTLADDDVRARVGAVADALTTVVPHDELLALQPQLPDRIGSLFVERRDVR